MNNLKSKVKHIVNECLKLKTLPEDYLIKNPICIGKYLNFKNLYIKYRIIDKLDLSKHDELIEHVSNSYNFNYLYVKYFTTGDKMFKPSIDHIIPKKHGGDDSPNNIRIVSYLENAMRNDTPIHDWCFVRENIRVFI